MSRSKTIIALTVVLSLIIILPIGLQAEDKQAETVICGACGATNNADSRFCKNCGEELLVLQFDREFKINTQTDIPNIGQTGDSLQVYKLTREEMVQLVEFLLRRMELAEEASKGDVKLVKHMTRKELEDLIRRLMYEQEKRKQSLSDGGGALGRLLQVVGGITLLVIFTLMLVG